MQVKCRYRNILLFCLTIYCNTANFCSLTVLTVSFHSIVDGFSSCVFSQTGLVQTAEDSLFIEPLGRTLDSFSGSEHRLIRQKHSSSDKSAPAVDSRPKFCQTIQGEKVNGLKNYASQVWRSYLEVNS